MVPVNVTVASPLASVTLDEPDSLPKLVYQLTVAPTPTGLPWASWTVATNVLLSVPLALIKVRVASRLIVSEQGNRLGLCT